MTNSIFDTLTATTTAPITREAWLEEGAALILDEIIMPVAGEFKRPPFRVSVGFPAGTRPGAKLKTIGQCFNRASSKDGHNEIFIHPELDDSLQVLDVLTHELIHAVDDCESGHKGEFVRIAKAVGLEGKMTATTAGDELKARLNTIVEALGPIPHASVDFSARKKQSTRMIKVECSCCQWSFRQSRARFQEITINQCLACGAEDALTADGGDEE